MLCQAATRISSVLVTWEKELLARSLQHQTYLPPGLKEQRDQSGCAPGEVRKGLNKCLDIVMHCGRLSAHHALLDEDAAQPGHGLLPLIHVGPVLRLGVSAIGAPRWSRLALPGAPALPGSCPWLRCPLGGPPRHSGLRAVRWPFAGGLRCLLRDTAWSAYIRTTVPPVLRHDVGVCDQKLPSFW